MDEITEKIVEAMHASKALLLKAKSSADETRKKWITTPSNSTPISRMKIKPFFCSLNEKIKPAECKLVELHSACFVCLLKVLSLSNRPWYISVEDRYDCA